MARQHKGEVMIAGEQLRYGERGGKYDMSMVRLIIDSRFKVKHMADLNFSRLRLHNGKLIKDRLYHLRTYPNCFVAKELIDWLVSHKEAPDRATAVCLMQHLMDHDIIHHGKQEATTKVSARGYSVQMYLFLMYCFI